MLAHTEIGQRTKRDKFILFWSGMAFLLVSLGFVILPTLNLGFVADDFFLLVPDQNYAPTQSPDELHRPLRNAVIRLMARTIGIQNVVPYRLLIAGSFVLVLILLFLLTRRLGANRFGALTAVFALAFCPRNHEVLNWFAAWQDIAAAAAVLCTCLFFLAFRESGRGYWLIVSVTAYLVALGFKETTVVVPVLLLSIDLYRERSPSAFLRPAFWKAYVLFGCALLAYIVYFFSQSGLASLEGKRAGGYYGFHGFTQVFTGLARSVLNMALPYPPSLALKDINFLYLAVLLFEAIVLFFLIGRLRRSAALLLSVSWVVCTILPTAAFAGYFNADRYLFVPMLGVALFVGLLVSALVALPDAKKYSVVVCVGVALYTFVGISQLAISRERFREEGRESSMVIWETMRSLPKHPPITEVVVVNLTLSFSNGLSEALHANGLSRSIRILRNFTATDPKQQSMVAKALQCVGSRPDGVGRRAILLQSDNKMVRPSTECASNVVDSDRAHRPEAWTVLFPAQ